MSPVDAEQAGLKWQMPALRPKVDTCPAERQDNAEGGEPHPQRVDVSLEGAGLAQQHLNVRSKCQVN